MVYPFGKSPELRDSSIFSHVYQVRNAAMPFPCNTGISTFLRSRNTVFSP